MSIRAIDWVFRNSEATQGDRLVLIALADYANDEGGSCFPSIAKIGAKAKLSDRQVERCLANLVVDREIEEAGRTPKGSKAWKLLMGEDPRQNVGLTKSDPDICDTITPTSAPSQPDICANAPHREPSVKPSIEPSEADSLDQLQHSPGPLDPNALFDAAVEEIFEAWRTGTGKNGASKLNPARRKKVVKRLEEAMDGVSNSHELVRLNCGKDELLEAVAGMVNSEWHRREGHQEFSQLFRDRGCIDKFVTRHRKHLAEAGSSAAEKYADYDRKVDEENGGTGGS